MYSIPSTFVGGVLHGEERYLPSFLRWFKHHEDGRIHRYEFVGIAENRAVFMWRSVEREVA